MAGEGLHFDLKQIEWWEVQSLEDGRQFILRFRSGSERVLLVAEPDASVLEDQLKQDASCGVFTAARCVFL